MMFGQTIVEDFKIKNIINLLKSVEKLNGDIAEVGVYRGGTASIISENTNSSIHLFDTFEGMPYHSPEMGEKWGLNSFNDTNFDSVKRLFTNKPNVKCYKGIFPIDTSHNIENLKFKFVHLDVDNYTSYKESLNFFYNRMVLGGIIVFDDYNCDCCPGANVAIDEFFNGKFEDVIIENSTAFIKKK